MTLNGVAAGLSRKTVIVLGAARGGTSMVAGTLAHLGVFMGEADQLAPFYEHSEFGKYLKSGDKSAARGLVREYDRRYPVWGVKTLSKRLWTWLGLFNEPVYVVVFRDVLATANRRSVSLGRSVLPEMLKIALHNLLLIGFVALSRRPTLLVSYEKTLLAPGDFVAALERFLGLDDEARRKVATDFIRPSPKAYTQRATTRAQMDPDGRWFGYVDIVETHRVAGWVASPNAATACTVELLVNGTVRQTVEACLARPDVIQSYGDLPLQCGFEFDLGPVARLHEGDVVDVRVVSEPHYRLANMPQPF